jgi:hypothetical protein
MLILRTLGVLLVILGFVTLAYDGASTLASPGAFASTSLHERWIQLSATDVDGAQAAVEKLGVPGLWPFLSWLLALPAWAPLGGVGVVLYWFGRRRVRETLAPE